MNRAAILLSSGLVLLLGLGCALLLRRGLWADQLRPLLQEADALGPVPSDPAELLAWRQAQCAINRQLQELQRQFGRPVETAQQMGRPPACEQLAQQP